MVVMIGAEDTVIDTLQEKYGNYMIIE